MNKKKKTVNKQIYRVMGVKGHPITRVKASSHAEAQKLVHKMYEEKIPQKLSKSKKGKK